MQTVYGDESYSGIIFDRILRSLAGMYIPIHN